MSQLLSCPTLRAALVGPDLTIQDLQAIVDTGVITKGDLQLQAQDETARKNIELALAYMEFEYPIFIPTFNDSIYTYQVNSNGNLKIKEICLQGLSSK